MKNVKRDLRNTSLDEFFCAPTVFRETNVEKDKEKPTLLSS
jgi:hypothetical protein